MGGELSFPAQNRLCLWTRYRWIIIREEPTWLRTPLHLRVLHQHLRALGLNDVLLNLLDMSLEYSYLNQNAKREAADVNNVGDVRFPWESPFLQVSGSSWHMYEVSWDQ